MTEDLVCLFEAEYTLDELDEPFDSAVVRQALQDALGFTGIIVTAVFNADGATDL